jgi:predicted TIM-barrel fold metal-dependent hydrolase
MRTEEMIIISIDDHICEPSTIFDNHLPAKWKDKAPKYVRDENGVENWVYEGLPTLNFAINAVVGRPREELGFEPWSMQQIRKGCYDPKARLDDMSVNGIVASVNFGTFAGFALEVLHMAKDKDAALAVLKAYNDWHIDEWCATDKNRFIPLVSLPLWNIQEAAAELKRTVKKGARSLSFPPAPTALGLPSIHNEYWKPLWNAVADTGVPISIHIGTGGGSEHVSLDSPADAYMSKAGLSTMSVLCEWLWSRIPRDYNDIKIVLSEGGLGWVPYIVERCDLVQKNHGPWTHQDIKSWGGKRPSDVFREHFYTCFIEDKFGVQNRHAVGIDNIMYECDYPHADVTWPYSPEQLMKNEFDGVPDEDINKITHLNAMKVYNFDPIAALGRQNCTVGALRKQAENVDISPQSQAGLAPSERDGHIVEARDLLRLFPQAPVRDLMKQDAA